MKRTAIYTFAILSLTAGIATAQTLPSDRYYVDAGIAADIDPGTFTEGNDTSLALVTGIGARLGHWTVRFEASIPDWHSESYDYAYTSSCGCGAGVVGRAAATASGVDQHRSNAFGFLVGHEFVVSPRVRLTPVGGIGINDHWDRGRGTETLRLASGQTMVLSDNSDTHESIASVQWGTDVAIALTRQIAIVPAIRFHTLPAYLETVVRPAITARISF